MKCLLQLRDVRARHFAKGDSRKPGHLKVQRLNHLIYTKKFKQMYGEQDKEKDCS